MGQPVADGRDFALFDGGRIAYEIAGSGPGVVLIHAGIADRRMWDGQFETLALRYRVLRYDVRGFGESDSPTQEFAHRDDLAHLLTLLGIERATLVGVSMAGSIALDTALDHPEAVGALVLTASGVSGVPPSEWLTSKTAEIDEAYESGDLARAVELETRLWFDGPHRTSDQVDPAIRARVYDMDMSNYERQETQTVRPRRLEPSAITRLEEVDLPTLVVVGDQDADHVLATADTLEARVPRATKVVVPSAGHMLSLERPQDFLHIVETFLKDVNSGKS